MTLDRKFHLAITSDRVVTETSNFDLLGKKAWGIYWYGPLQSSAPPLQFPHSLTVQFAKIVIAVIPMQKIELD